MSICYNTEFTILQLFIYLKASVLNYALSDKKWFKYNPLKLLIFLAIFFGSMHITAFNTSVGISQVLPLMP